MVDVPLRDCIRLFWSPLNSTFETLQRNALLLFEAADASVPNAVCIVEIDGESILTDPCLWWALTNGHAGSPLNSYDADRLPGDARFNWLDWPAVFDNHGEDPSGRRAAGLIVRVPAACARCSGPLPAALIRRILCSPESAGAAQEQVRNAGSQLPVETAAIYTPVSELLEPERELAESLADASGDDMRLLDCFCAGLRALVRYRRLAGPLAAEQFGNREMAYGQHGIGHVVRVMLWSAVLCLYETPDAGEQALLAAMTAARCHDLCKLADMEDIGHGARAAARFEDFARGLLADETLLRGCLRAVALHDPQDGDIPNEARTACWRTLKDADALDRGRFGPPTTPGSKGPWIACNTSMLRSRRLRPDGDPGGGIAWAAYRLARVTRHTPWGPDPELRLVRSLGNGMRAARAAGLFASHLLEAAARIEQAALDAAVS
jgi:hypothetical protein